MKRSICLGLSLSAHFLVAAPCLADAGRAPARSLECVTTVNGASALTQISAELIEALQPQPGSPPFGYRIEADETRNGARRLSGLGFIRSTGPVPVLPCRSRLEWSLVIQNPAAESSTAVFSSRWTTFCQGWPSQSETKTVDYICTRK